VITTDGQCGGSSDEAGADNELRFITKTGVSLFFCRKITVENFMEDGGMSGGFVALVDAVPDFADLFGEVL